MPFDILADFRQRPDASKLDQFWSGLARSIVVKLAELEPRLRFRIRNFPPVFSITAGDKGAADIKTGIALTEEDVPKQLRPFITVPEGDEYWIHNYRCDKCINPSTGSPGLWVPHIRRKLHQGPNHELKDLGITAKGVEQTWTVTHRIVIGDIERVRGLGDLLYSVALIGPIEDTALLAGFDVALVIPIKTINVVEQLKLLGKTKRLEHFKVYPPDPKAAVTALIEDLKTIDPKCLKPETNFDNLEDDLEYKQQLAREKLASRVMASMSGMKSTSEIKGALK